MLLTFSKYKYLPTIGHLKIRRNYHENYWNLLIHYIIIHFKIIEYYNGFMWVHLY